MKKALLTGFPGFISKHYLDELLRSTEIKTFNFLVHPSMLEVCEKQLEVVRKSHPEKEFYVYEGDITVAGISIENDLEVDSVHHLAAMYDLAMTEQAGERVNVQGTRNVINWCKSNPSVKQIIYFSTCYVLGKKSVLKEEFIDHPGGITEFNNHYEHSKWKAEDLFREVNNALIIRPSVVVGHSLTGITEKEDGPYYVINLMKKLKYFSLLCPNLGDEISHVNTIPVDTLCKLAVVHALEHEKSGFKQKIVNLADPKPPTSHQYYEKIIETVTNRQPVNFPKLQTPILKSLRFPGLHRLTGIKPTTIDYFSWQGSIETKSVKPEDFPMILEHLKKTIYP